MSNAITDAFTAIADAIRKRTGKTDKMDVAEMPAEIAGIPTGGHGKALIERTITSYESNDLTAIGSYAFSYCKSLASVSFPAVKTIEDDVFSGCNFTSVDFPSVTSLGSGALRMCENLTSVKIGSKNPKVCTMSASDVFYNTPIYSGKGFIYVPDALVEDYKKATNWAFHANQIKPLSEAPTI